MNYRKKKLNSIVVLLMFIVSMPSGATLLTYNGTLEHIFIDTGSSPYAGATVGDSYFGHFEAGNSVNESKPILPCLNDECEYLFSGPPYNAAISNATTTQTTTDLSIIIWDEYNLEHDDAATVNMLPGVSLEVGTLLDAWIGSAFIGTKGNAELLFVSFDTSLYSDLQFQALPDITRTDLAIFFIQESDDVGNIIFEGIGTINSVSKIPITATFWLFALGLTCLMGKHLGKRV
ncbi:hypothetical protein [Thalassomonas actiniarum]|uniref:IPTL-CTERM protein sorting domain-containing protein n=1 Tax=Thalassomonas actiniarum TaxID=485447 RepID=A0AAE9YXU7_9GAMM|nr:hypothetical protein [Thalassomonas actiniarum]WDE02557.1 hypothetical protein SG35_029575 [Thalassomonas actiniarum]